MTRFLLAALLALSGAVQAQYGGMYTSKAGSAAGTVVATSVTAPCTTANAVLYNASTPCSANLTFTQSGGASTMLIGATSGASAFTGLSLANSTGTELAGFQYNPSSGEVKFGGFNSGGFFPVIYKNNAAAMAWNATAGHGPSITAGTTADNTGRALSISGGWTDGTSGNIGAVFNFDMGATGTATGKLIDLQAGAAGTSSVFSVSEGGQITTALGMQTLSGTNINSNGYFRLATRGYLYAPSDGVWTLYDEATTSFGRLQFGGTTSSFPSLKRNGAILETKLADDSAYARHDVLSVYSQAAGAHGWLGRAEMLSPVDGTVTVQNTATTRKFYIAAALPTVGSCGTDPAVAGVDSAMVATVGTGGAATACVMNFSAAKTTAPSCTAISDTDIVALKLSTSTTAVTVTATAPFTASSKLHIHCFEYL